MQQRRTRKPDRPCEGGEQRESGRRPALFGLGSVYATPSVLDYLSRVGRSPAELLGLHQSGCWGDLVDEDRTANSQAVQDGSRILSLYIIGDRRIYVITEAESENGTRVATTLLFAEEY